MHTRNQTKMTLFETKFPLALENPI